MQGDKIALGWVGRRQGEAWGKKAGQAEGGASPGPEVCSQEASEAAGRELVGWLTQAWRERVAQWGLLRGGRHSDGILSALGSCCAVCSLLALKLHSSNSRKAKISSWHYLSLPSLRP